MATPLSNLSYDEPIDNVFDDEFDEADFQRFIIWMETVTPFIMITQVIKSFLILGVLGINIYFIAIICKNKNLKTIKANRYLMHCSIFNLFMWMTEPIYANIMTVLRLYPYLGWRMYCVEREFETTGMIGMFLCMLGIGIEWLLVVNKINMKPFTQRLYDSSILIIYLLCIIKMIMDYIVCNSAYYIRYNFIEHVLLFALFVFVIYCNIKKKKLKAKNSYLLSVINVFVFSWIPVYCYDILLPESRSYVTINVILRVTKFIPEYLAYGSPIVIFIWLGRINKYFKAAYQKSCSCCTCCRVIIEYSGGDETFVDSGEIEPMENVENMSNNATLL
ncbi:uncharacterized protein [Diabrotica undecimpunctata]|uniref:uncharacterized protein n=1 Tax=Diabrotica undecimpunctata TaxID=50387 RepID=UPI003B63ACEA